MEHLLLVLSVTALFLIRIGVPVIVLISLGMLINRWQNRREATLRRELSHNP